MEEQRSCARCGAPLQLNTRARATHRFCRSVDCQRERRRVAQEARRAACSSGLSTTGKAAWAAYMKRYREAHAAYREREREAARRRRNEAGSSCVPAKVYLLPGPGAELRVRVVSEAGLAVTMGTGVSSARRSERRNEAG